MSEALATYSKIEVIIRSMAHKQEIYRVWRIAVKDIIDKEFGEVVPWALCIELMRIYWEKVSRPAPNRRPGAPASDAVSLPLFTRRRGLRGQVARRRVRVRRG